MSGYSLLSGVRVLEVAQLAPSSAGGHLADLGAEVIKVESGPFGDPVRAGGALAVGGPGGPAFMHLRWNRGKKSVRLDLRDDQGKAAFLDLAGESDVVIEGTRAGYLEWLGLGYDVLAAANPRLVFCQISGLGTDGPYRHLGSGGPVFDAYAGLRTVRTPDEPPADGMAGSATPPIAMYALGAYGAMGILAALWRANQTGQGSRLEVAGIDVAASWMPDGVDAKLNQKNVVPRSGWLPDGRLPDWPRLEAYRTRDGAAILFGAHVEKFWRNFCLAVGRPDLLGIDLSTADKGAAGRAERVWRELKDIFATRTRAEWIEVFVEHDIAGGPVNSFDDVADALTWRDRVLVILPMAFTGGTSTYLRESLVTGATAVVGTGFDPPRVLELLERERITICSAVPVIWEMLLTLPQLGRADLSALRACIGAGATTPVEVIRAWQARGVGMRQGYGQTEFAGGYATLLYEDEAEHKVGSVGRPIVHHEIRIADQHDRDVPAGQPGQILLRGPSVMAGYHNNPEATADALAGGWLHTGDIGVLDEDGYLTIVDRAKDMLISGGLNVYPAEIEAAIAGLPGLEECAVIGVPDDRWGEVPMLVVPSLEGIDIAAVKAAVTTRLADYRRPRWITGFGAPLPRTLGGKIVRREIRSRYPAVPAGAASLR